MLCAMLTFLAHISPQKNGQNMGAKLVGSSKLVWQGKDRMTKIPAYRSYNRHDLEVGSKSFSMA